VGELAVQDQERQPAEVVTVQVGDRHRADGVRVQPLGLERHQAGGAAVNQQHLPPGGQADARLPAPAAAERITAAYELHPHDLIVTQPASRHCSLPLRHVQAITPALAMHKHTGRAAVCWRAWAGLGRSIPRKFESSLVMLDWLQSWGERAVLGGEAGVPGEVVEGGLVGAVGGAQS
jgi:hypothetical protein